MKFQVVAALAIALHGSQWPWQASAQRISDPAARRTSHDATAERVVVAEGSAVSSSSSSPPLRKRLKSQHRRSQERRSLLEEKYDIYLGLANKDSSHEQRHLGWHSISMSMSMTSSPTTSAPTTSAPTTSAPTTSLPPTVSPTCRIDATCGPDLCFNAIYASECPEGKHEVFEFLFKVHHGCNSHVPVGGLCEANGECGTANDLDNCKLLEFHVLSVDWDVYRRVECC